MTKLRHGKTAIEAVAIYQDAGVQRSRRTIIRYAEAGTIKGEKMPGATGQWLFSEPSVRKHAATLAGAR